MAQSLLHLHGAMTADEMQQSFEPDFVKRMRQVFELDAL